MIVLGRGGGGGIHCQVTKGMAKVYEAHDNNTSRKSLQIFSYFQVRSKFQARAGKPSSASFSACQVH